MTSIRAKLIAGLVGAVLLVAAVAGTVLLLVVRDRVTDDFDAALSAKARAMAGMVRYDDKGKVEMEFSEELMGEFKARRRPEYFQVRFADGRILESSPSLAGRELATGASSPHAVTLPDGRSGRAVSVTFAPEAADEDDKRAATSRPPAVTLTLARGTNSIERMTQVVGWGLAGAAAVMAVGAAAAVWVLVNRGLRPLRGVAEQAAAIDADTLTARFGTDVPSELAPIVRRLNELLARLESAFARERRFTAAAAHELRTPIAELCAMAEVAIRWPGESSNPGMTDVLAVARNMESLAASLLALSRCESGQERAQRQPVDLSAAAARAWDAARKCADERGVTLRLDHTDDGIVSADPAMTDAVVRNLLDNAVEYAPPGTEVLCRVGGRKLAIENAQDGLTGDDLSHLFEPFWRKDKARSSGVHAGLGLSLVKAYASAMGADVRATLTPDRRFRIELAFAGTPAATHTSNESVMLPSSSIAMLPADVG